MKSFTEKTIKVTVFLREGEFGQGNNTVAYEGLPTQVHISKTGDKDGCKAEVIISNMKLDTARQLTMLALARCQSPQTRPSGPLQAAHGICTPLVYMQRLGH